MVEISGWLASKGVDAQEAKAMVAQMTRGVCAMCLESGKDMAKEGRNIGRPGIYAGLNPHYSRAREARTRRCP